MMRWVSLTRLISGVSRTKAALPWTCLRKLSEYSTWWTKGGGSGNIRFKPESYHPVAVSIYGTKGVVKRSGRRRQSC